MPWVYNEYESSLTKQNGNISETDYNKIFLTDKQERERAFVFSFIIGTLYKNKVVKDYKSPKVRNQISSTMGISEKSYFRHIKSCLTVGLCSEENNNLRFRSHHDFGEEVADVAKNTLQKSYKLRAEHKANISLKSRNFEYCRAVLQFVFVKYTEHRKLLNLSSNIRKSRRRAFASDRKGLSNLNSDKLLVHCENNISKGRKWFMSNSKAEAFKEVYNFVYSKTRRTEPKNLGSYYAINRNRQEIEKLSGKGNKRSIISKAFDSLVNDGIKMNFENSEREIGYHKSTDYPSDRVIDERIRIRNKNLEIKKAEILNKNKGKKSLAVIDTLKDIDRKMNSPLNDNFTRVMSSNMGFFDFEEFGINKSLSEGIGRVNNESSGNLVETNKQIPDSFENTKFINGFDISKFNNEAFYMHHSELRSLLNNQIYSPDQFFTLLSSDFKSEFRFGVTKMAEMFGITRGQCSRRMKTWEKFGIMEKQRRYVFLTTINRNDTKSFINSLKKEFSLLHEDDISKKSYFFSRIRFHKGCLLYEIESNKQTLIPLEMRRRFLYGDIYNDDNALYQSKRYGKLQKTI